MNVVTQALAKKNLCLEKLFACFELIKDSIKLGISENKLINLSKFLQAKHGIGIILRVLFARKIK